MAQQCNIKLDILFFYATLLPFWIHFTQTFSLFMSKVDHVVRLSSLIQRLQEERAAVALNLFINRTSSLDTLNDLQGYVKTPGWDITRFSYRKVAWILKDLCWSIMFYWYIEYYIDISNQTFISWFSGFQQNGQHSYDYWGVAQIEKHILLQKQTKLSNST